MADQKVTDLTAKTSLSLTDLLYLVDVAGGNLDKKITIQNFFTG
jgi:hypothetical protein